MFRLPDLDDITAIKVTIADIPQNEGPTGIFELPSEQWKIALDYLKPAKPYADGKPSDDIFPVICVVEIETSNSGNQSFQIRWMGKNPLLISADGKSHFWAENPSDITDSATAYLVFVTKHGVKQKK